MSHVFVFLSALVLLGGCTPARQSEPQKATDTPPPQSTAEPEASPPPLIGTINGPTIVAPNNAGQIIQNNGQQIPIFDLDDTTKARLLQVPKDKIIILVVENNDPTAKDLARKAGAFLGANGYMRVGLKNDMAVGAMPQRFEFDWRADKEHPELTEILVGYPGNGE